MLTYRHLSPALRPPTNARTSFEPIACVRCSWTWTPSRVFSKTASTTRVWHSLAARHGASAFAACRASRRRRARPSGARCRRTRRCSGRSEHPRSARVLAPPLNGKPFGGRKPEAAGRRELAAACQFPAPATLAPALACERQCTDVCTLPASGPVLFPKEEPLHEPSAHALTPPSPSDPDWWGGAPAGTDIIGLRCRIAMWHRRPRGTSWGDGRGFGHHGLHDRSR
jgi:hypothetical protein